jgi:hypothetical protein
MGGFIKIDLNKPNEAVDWIYMYQERVTCRAVGNAVMNVRALQNLVNFLTS